MNYKPPFLLLISVSPDPRIYLVLVSSAHVLLGELGVLEWILVSDVIFFM